MKIPLLWIIGVAVAAWLFFDNNHSNFNTQLESQERVTATTIPTPNSSYTFGRYSCTVDCSGHEAGYKWAEEHDIDDPDDCGGNSESFIEGCRTYAEENSAQEDDDD